MEELGRVGHLCSDFGKNGSAGAGTVRSRCFGRALEVLGSDFGI
jgi:hypothetical protein